MDKKFLRVGNYVLNNHNGRSRYAMVAKANWKGQLTISLESERLGSEFYRISSLELTVAPIPINKQWLHSFGFKLMPESEYTLNTYELNGIEVWDKKGDFSEVLFLTNKLSVTLQGVHHLQNLYYELFQDHLELKDNSLVTLRLECN